MKKSNVMTCKKSFLSLLFLVFLLDKTDASNNLNIVESKNPQQIYEECQATFKKVEENLNKCKVTKNHFDQLIKRADNIINTLEGLPSQNEILKQMDRVCMNIYNLLSCKSDTAKNWLSKVSNIKKFDIYTQSTSILPFNLIKNLQKEEEKLKKLIEKAKKNKIPENHTIMHLSMMYYKETAKITKLSSEIEKEVVKLRRRSTPKNRNKEYRNIPNNNHSRIEEKHQKRWFYFILSALVLSVVVISVSAAYWFKKRKSN